jgi:hypothetical protein
MIGDDDFQPVLASVGIGKVDHQIFTEKVAGSTGEINALKSQALLVVSSDQTSHRCTSAATLGRTIPSR